MAKSALLVVDVQTGMINESTYQKDRFVAALQRLLGTARERGVPVIYIRHCDSAGGELEAGSDSWQIFEAIAPRDGEKIFDKRFNSAFRQTGLREYLNEAGIESLVLAGMMTEYCLDATCKVAFEYGYSLRTAPEINTTLGHGDVPPEEVHRYYNNVIWNKRFASVIPLDELCEALGRE